MEVSSAFLQHLEPPGGWNQLGSPSSCLLRCEALADGPRMGGKDAATGDVCGRDEGLCWEPAVDGDVNVV